MKYQLIIPHCISNAHRNSTKCILFSVALTCSTAVFAQQKTELRSPVYEQVVDANRDVKIQSIKNGRVQTTETVALRNVEVPLNTKTVISYDKKVSAIDPATYSRLKADNILNLHPDQLKILPEFHVIVKGAGEEETVYRIVFTSLYPFRYNDSLKKFNARMGFLLMRESGDNSNNTIEPVNIEVASNDAIIEPNHLQIKHLNLPSTNVDLIADRINDSAKVKVITNSNPEGYATFVKVKSNLEISSNRSTLQGMGIQKIPVTVRFIGSSSADSVKVNFSVEKGTVHPTSMYISYNKPATIYLTSEGTGQARLTASSFDTTSNDLYFDYVFPFIFLLSSLAGGLAGAMAKYYLNATGKRKFAMKPIAGGILVGILGAVAYYALGINLLGFKMSAGLNELAVFGFSGLCSYFGISRKE